MVGVSHYNILCYEGVVDLQFEKNGFIHAGMYPDVTAMTLQQGSCLCLHLKWDVEMEYFVVSRSETLTKILLSFASQLTIDLSMLLIFAIRLL